MRVIAVRPARLGQPVRGQGRGAPDRGGLLAEHRHVPDLAARPLSAGVLSNLIDRRPYLLGPLAAQLLPPPLPSTDPAKHLGIDVPSLRTVEDVRPVLSAVLAAVARGEIAPAEAARIARGVRARLRAVRRLAGLA